jgi:hypothetical protein
MVRFIGLNLFFFIAIYQPTGSERATDNYTSLPRNRDGPFLLFLKLPFYKNSKFWLGLDLRMKQKESPTG